MNIYIGNLSLETTELELRRTFEPFGEVLSVTMLNDEYIASGQPRGYAYVNMACKSDGKQAIDALYGITLRGHAVTVVEALPLTRKNPASPEDGPHRFNRNKSRSHRSF